MRNSFRFRRVAIFRLRLEVNSSSRSRTSLTLRDKSEHPYPVSVCGSTKQEHIFWKPAVSPLGLFIPGRRLEVACMLSACIDHVLSSAGGQAQTPTERAQEDSDGGQAQTPPGRTQEDRPSYHPDGHSTGPATTRTDTGKQAQAPNTTRTDTGVL